MTRITVDPEVCGGRPCIRGLRVRVADVLHLLAADASRVEILKDYPYLEAEDIDAVVEFAARTWKPEGPHRTDSGVVHSDKDIMGGTLVFVGTRVPAATLFDYLRAGDTLAEFLEDFPTVSRAHAVAALEQAAAALLGPATPDD